MPKCSFSFFTRIENSEKAYFRLQKYRTNNDSDLVPLSIQTCTFYACVPSQWSSIAMHKNAATISDSICQACDRFYAGTPTPSPYPPPLMPAAFCLGNCAPFRYLGHVDVLLRPNLQHSFCAKSASYVFIGVIRAGKDFTAISSKERLSGTIRTEVQCEVLRLRQAVSFIPL